MPLAALFASHTPLKDYLDPGPGVAAEVAGVLDEARAFVQAFAPDVVIEFAPDHFNGFFYRLMPSFCIGAAAESIGDWKTIPGLLNVDGALALRLVEAAHADGVDAALSHRMEVDHGFTQLLEILFEPGTAPPLVPVFINCAAPPRPPMRRVQALGAAQRTLRSADANLADPDSSLQRQASQTMGDLQRAAQGVAEGDGVGESAAEGFHEHRRHAAFTHADRRRLRRLAGIAPALSGIG